MLFAFLYDFSFFNPKKGSRPVKASAFFCPPPFYSPLKTSAIIFAPSLKPSMNISENS